MGDISELRGLVVILSFVGSLVLLIGLIPSAFLVPAYTGRTVDIPAYFDSVDMLFFAETINQTLDDSGDYDGAIYYYNMLLGGHNLRMYDLEASRLLAIDHYDFWWIFPTNFVAMEWINKDGLNRDVQLIDTEIDEDYTEGNIKYTVKTTEMRMMVFFGFNETKYSTPSDAWDGNELALLLAIEFDQVNTSVNGWQLISMLLFFQLPAIDLLINAIIAIPIWVGIAYISYILLLRAIGAIFGGGA